MFANLVYKHIIEKRRLLRQLFTVSQLRFEKLSCFLERAIELNPLRFPHKLLISTYECQRKK